MISVEALSKTMKNVR